MNYIESYLNPEGLKSLYPYQIQKLNLEINNFIKTNTELDDVSFEYCPKCNTYHPNIIKGDKSNTGKQMYCCIHCIKNTYGI